MLAGKPTDGVPSCFLYALHAFRKKAVLVMVWGCMQYCMHRSTRHAGSGSHSAASTTRLPVTSSLSVTAPFLARTQAGCSSTTDSPSTSLDAGGAAGIVTSGGASAVLSGLSWLDRLLPVWIILAMVAGVLLGSFVPQVRKATIVQRMWLCLLLPQAETAAILNETSSGKESCC